LNRNIFVPLATITMLASVSVADSNGPYIMSVDDLLQLQPSAQWNPDVDDISVVVRGYLRDSINMHLYPTKDQALLDDWNSGVPVSDEGEAKLRQECSEGFVELLAKVTWAEKEREVVLIPMSAKKLTLREHLSATESICWEAN
jgi:hypothetical protein